ncbi:28S ribosomal protein S5, mitochondrial [Tieghemiomyces parasiticus]|uniref:Small ribosomal subunit protein uS5m n=1 Tax=Tieghemiomyces parasiticus TaxID=78921 RepID=A0A9W7ZTK1_9FUNG|nr:28S ribosomal protein S5, mitochondrial [Tieghemiomyces parasiticus]
MPPVATGARYFSRYGVLHAQPIDSPPTGDNVNSTSGKPASRPQSQEELTLEEYADKKGQLWTNPDGTAIKTSGVEVEDIELPKPDPEASKYFMLLQEEEESLWKHNMGIDKQQFQQLQKRVLHVHRTVNMTRKGKQQSMYALVVVGTGEGVAGYGEAKGDEVADAVRKATARAIRSLRFIPRYDNRTVYHDLQHKFKATHISLFARPPGFGKRVNPYLYEICQVAGIQDLAGKVRGSRNPMNVIKAMFEALGTQRTPEDIAVARGKKLVDVHSVYYGGQP